MGEKVIGAWVLRLKEEISSTEYDGRPLYLCDDESIDFLTAELSSAEVIYDKDAEIKGMKYFDEYMIGQYGEDSIRNFGWENISKNFDFVKVEVEVETEE